MTRRVVITSIGVVSALGSRPDEILHALANGGAPFERAAFDPDVCTCPIGGGFDLKDFTGRYKNARYLNRGAQFSLVSAMVAVQAAALPPEKLERAGLFVGSGPNLDVSGEFPDIRRGKVETESLAALWILRFLPNTAASAISSLAGIHGENATIGTACSASLQAIGEAYRRVKGGYMDLAFAGGGDSRLTPGGILAYRKAQALWTGEGDGAREYSPFDRDRKGFVPGEGGAFFLLEELEHARRRRTPILAEVCGFGASMDGFNMTAPDPSGAWAETAVRTALQEGALAPSQIDVVSAHGTGTPLNDSMEADLIARIFQKRSPYVIALKSRIGHLAAACGAVELAIGVACMHRGYLPAIRNLNEPCRKDVSFVRTPMSVPIGAMVFQSFGFGGQNSALAVKRWRE